MSDEPYLIWRDNEDVNHEDTFVAHDATLPLFIVRAMTPHAIVNRSDRSAFVLELADDIQLDVEPANLLRGQTECRRQ